MPQRSHRTSTPPSMAVSEEDTPIRVTGKGKNIKTRMIRCIKEQRIDSHSYRICKFCATVTSLARAPSILRTAHVRNRLLSFMGGSGRVPLRNYDGFRRDPSTASSSSRAEYDAWQRRRQLNAQNSAPTVQRSSANQSSEIDRGVGLRNNFKNTFWKTACSARIFIIILSLTHFIVASVSRRGNNYPFLASPRLLPSLRTCELPSHAAAGLLCNRNCVGSVDERASK